MQMIHFSPAKINIGLQVLEKRDDGFHNLQSLMYPVALCDIIEINQLPTAESPLTFSQSGIRFDSDLEKNLCIRAWELVSAERKLPPVAIHLHKQIPIGAGLGGGSSNASTIISGLNQVLSSPLSPERLAGLAGQLGSDCPFFLHKVPMIMEGIGDILSPARISLKTLHLVILFPEIHISTAEAYRAVSPLQAETGIQELLKTPVARWKNLLINDFEKSAFTRYPELKFLKNSLYDAGAIYASMSGSGSSLYGLFKSPPVLPESVQKYVLWTGPA
jgi:4-diphosphocytidyl-2-C-methyl-D-erythritol kinase